ncbi:MAG: creatininase family protein [Gemmatimonadetes bacterium]|nr:creatininase family protein [Gemmatimonadota bacterium]
MTHPVAAHRDALRIKFLTPAQVRAHLARDPRLIVPVGTTEQHGPHLPLGCDTIIVERLASDLSAEFGVLAAPTVEYGVNAGTEEPFAGSAGLRRKTLHRLMNDLVGSWEAGGVREFVILTAHGQDPHQEALSTLRTREAVVRTVDIFAIPLSQENGPDDVPVHGGPVDTSLLLYIDGGLVARDQARDFLPTPREARRYRHGGARAIPRGTPGSFGRPTTATADEGARLYGLIYDRIASRVFRREPA